MPRYRITVDVQIDIRLNAKSASTARHLATDAVRDRGNRELTDLAIGNRPRLTFMGDSVEVKAVERIGA